jgi:hypothetical protein
MGAHRTSLPVVVEMIAILGVVPGCSRTAPTAPNPPEAEVVPPEPTIPAIAVRLEGQVLDADRQQPISGVSVTTEGVLSAGSFRWPSSPTSTVTDGNGTYVLNATLPADWGGVMLGLVQSGYDSTGVYTTRTSGVVGTPEKSGSVRHRLPAPRDSSRRGRVDPGQRQGTSQGKPPLAPGLGWTVTRPNHHDQADEVSARAARARLESRGL